MGNTQTGISNLETCSLRSWESEATKFAARRKNLRFRPHDMDMVVTFTRLGNYVLCELYAAPCTSNAGDRVAFGISHKSQRCHSCGEPGDKWSDKIGKTLALWSALRAMAEERAAEYG